MRSVRAPAVYNSLKASEDHYVELQTEQMNDGTMKVNLLGRLDIVGTNAIDLRFTSLTATRKANVIVDLSGVDFLASMGVRLLLSNAKALGFTRGQDGHLQTRPDGKKSARDHRHRCDYSAIRRRRFRAPGTEATLNGAGLGISISLDTQPSCRNALN